MAADRKKRRPRDPAGTREAILEAARTRLAQDGPEGLSLSEVARLAGVNRGTAYQHFQTREKLIEATTAWVSEKLYRAAFGDPEDAGKRAVESIDIPVMTDRLAAFAMENPELCRVWFLQLLASPEPAKDLFLREYLDLMRRFGETDRAEPGIDAEVATVIMLAGIFLFPIWAQAHGGSGARDPALRLSDEVLRLSLFGTMRSESFPDIVARLRAAQPRSG